MRIRARPSRRRAERITLNLASMIDVTFLLLIYFMVTMVLQDQEDHLSPTLQTQLAVLDKEDGERPEKKNDHRIGSWTALREHRPHCSFHAG